MVARASFWNESVATPSQFGRFRVLRGLQEHPKSIMQRIMEQLVVQKFGGSSVGTPERILHVADRVAARSKSGTRLVVVVSAMQGETDRLLGLANAVAERPDIREVDQLLATGEQASAALLAMALRGKGIPSRSMIGT